MLKELALDKFLDEYARKCEKIKVTNYEVNNNLI